MKILVERLQPHLCQQGFGGLTRLLDNHDHGYLTRLLLAIDNRFLGLAQLARKWVAIEKRLEHEKASEVGEELFDYLAIDVRSNRLPSEFCRPKQAAIILGLNHESIIEPLVFVSLLKRNDFQFIGMKVFQYLGQNFAKYILPVLPKKVGYDYDGQKKPTWSNRLDPVFQLYLLENRSVDEITRLNSNSINQAADHLLDGGLLIIFPNGGRDINHPWYRGTGQIVSQVPPELLSKIPIFSLRTTGLSRKYLFQKARQAVFDRRESDNIHVHVFDPIYIPYSIARASPERILEYLKEQTDSYLAGQRDLITTPTDKDDQKVSTVLMRP